MRIPFESAIVRRIRYFPIRTPSDCDLRYFATGSPCLCLEDHDLHITFQMRNLVSHVAITKRKISEECGHEIIFQASTATATIMSCGNYGRVGGHIGNLWQTFVSSLDDDRVS